MSDADDKTRHGGPGRKRLEALLDERNEHPERLVEIDREIERAFAETLAILVLDMAGFSRLTQRHGTTHFLAMIRRMNRAVCPLIETAGGRVVKTEADNVFAVFPTVDLAVRAAELINGALADANRHLPADWDVHVSIGIGWGRVLVIDGDDLYGHEMNIASKLGEDLAGPGDVFLTEAAYAALAEAPPGRFERADVAGVELAFFACARSG